VLGVLLADALRCALPVTKTIITASVNTAFLTAVVERCLRPPTSLSRNAALRVLRQLIVFNNDCIQLGRNAGLFIEVVNILSTCSPISTDFGEEVPTKPYALDFEAVDSAIAIVGNAFALEKAMETELRELFAAAPKAVSVIAIFAHSSNAMEACRKRAAATLSLVAPESQTRLADLVARDAMLHALPTVCQSPTAICSVCEEEGPGNGKLVTTPCFCVLHFKCLKKWLEEPGKESCPKCAINIFTGIHSVVALSTTR
jgi:hypothetical protein